MSVENWGPFAALRVRLILCGHIFDRPVPENAGNEIDCPVCLKPHPAPTGFGCKIAPLSRGPTPQLAWTGLQRAKTRKFRRKKYKWAPVSCLDELLAELAASTSCIDLQSSRLAPKHGPRDDTTFLVYRASPNGSTVRHGVIELPEQGVLLLDGAGAHFDGIKFSGAAVICAGSRYSGTFRECEFHDCQLYVVHGAAVALHGCTFRGSNPALTCAGPRTTAHLSHCTLTDCAAALVIEGRAAATVASSAIDSSITGAAVIDVGAHVTLRDTTLRGGHSNGIGVCGVLVQGGAAALHRCGIESFSVACMAPDAPAVLEVRDTEIRDCLTATRLHGHCHALFRRVVMEDAHAEASDAVIVGMGPAEHERSQAAFEQSEVCWPTGFNACYLSRVAVSRCDIKTQDLAVKAEGVACRVLLADCRATSPGVCVSTSGLGCVLRAVRCDLEGGVSAAGATDRAELTLVNSTATGRACAPQPGAIVTGTCDAVVRLHGCSVSGGPEGVRLCHSRCFSINTTVSRIQRSWEGYHPSHKQVSERALIGCAYALLESLCEVTGGRVEHCSFGVVVRGARHACACAGGLFSKVEIEHCDDAFRVEAAPDAAGGSNVAIMDCVISEARTGVKVANESAAGVDVRLYRVDMKGHCEAVDVEGAMVDLVLNHCTMMGFHDGVVLRGVCTALMQDVSILDGGSGVSIGPSSYRGRCWACGREGGEAERAAWDAACASEGANVPGARCAHEGAIARVMMERVSVTCMSGEGITVDEQGHLAATEVHVRECEVGIHVEYIAEESRFERCSVVPLPGEAATVVYQRESFSDADHSLDDDYESSSGDDEIEGVEILPESTDVGKILGRNTVERLLGYEY